MITAENARINQQKSVEARRLAKFAQPAPDPVPEVAGPALQIADGYHEARLVRVRAQLDRIDEMMLDEDDPGKLDRLASAQARLSEQERILRGEPLPGSRRPAPERKSSRGQSQSSHGSGSFHTKPIPQPVVSSVVKPSTVQVPSTPDDVSH